MFIFRFGCFCSPLDLQIEKFRTENRIRHVTNLPRVRYSRNPAVRTGNKVARVSKTKEKTKSKENQSKNKEHLRYKGARVSPSMFLSGWLYCKRIATYCNTLQVRNRLCDPRKCPGRGAMHMQHSILTSKLFNSGLQKEKQPII